MKKIWQLFSALAINLAIASSSQASLYTTNFGSNAGNPSDCDDCFSGIWNFAGAGQSINFFGNTYGGLFVGSNGYVTFGSGASNYTTIPLDTQNIRPMIAGSFNDLDSRNDAASNVFINNTTAGEIIATWVDMGHYSQNYGARSTFQLVIRSDQKAVAPGEGQIGFFYSSIADTSATSAGFGDGSTAVNPGEIAFASNVSGTTLSNIAPRWFNINGGTPTTVPAPGGVALFGLGLACVALVRRNKRNTM